MNLECLDVNEIMFTIWQGAYPQGYEADIHENFDVIVLSAKSIQPPDYNFPGIKVLRVELTDVDPPEEGTFEKAEAMARQLAPLVQAGKRVLITCHAGLNRSGLITALTLRELTGAPGIFCVEKVQSKRRDALFNKSFAFYVKSLFSKTVAK